MTVEVFGEILHGGQVEQAALDILRAWTPTYINEMCRQTGRDVGSLPYVRSWTVVNDFEKWPEDQLPCVLVISPGLAEPPTREGDGTYSARWALGTGVIVSSRSQEETNEYAKLYSAAIRAALLQNGSLAGFAEGTWWEDERYNDLPSEDGRSLAAGQNLFTVEVRGVLASKEGPGTPDPHDDPEEDYDPVTVREGGAILDIEKEDL